MTRRLGLATFIVPWLTMAAFGAPVFAAPPKGAEQKVEAKSGAPRTPPLASANLVGEFGDAYTFLADLGLKIDQARAHADASQLAAAAVAINLAEKASGKKSDKVSSAKLLDEAWDLCKKQKNAAAGALVSKAYAAVGDAARSAEAEKGSAAFRAESEKLATRAPGDYVGLLKFVNWTAFAFDLQIGGTYIGTVAPYGTLGSTIYEGSTGRVDCAEVTGTSAGGTQALVPLSGCFKYRGEIITVNLR